MEIFEAENGKLKITTPVDATPKVSVIDYAILVADVESAQRQFNAAEAELNRRKKRLEEANKLGLKPVVKSV